MTTPDKMARFGRRSHFVDDQEIPLPNPCASETVELTYCAGYQGIGVDTPSQDHYIDGLDNYVSLKELGHGGSLEGKTIRLVGTVTQCRFCKDNLIPGR